MKYFVANIDQNNFVDLDEASSQCKVKFKKGVYMSLGDNREILYSFYPIFCESPEDGVTLMKKYHELAKRDESNSNLNNDSCYDVNLLKNL